MFSALHWEYLHRRKLVPGYPAVLGVAAGQPGTALDDELLRQLLHWGVLVEADGVLGLSEPVAPVFEAFNSPALTLFGTMLMYQDARPGPEVPPDLPEHLRRLAEANRVVIPQAKFLVAVTDAVVSSAVQFQGHVAVGGVDCAHADPLVQGARVLWEALDPGPAWESLPVMTVPMQACTAVAGVQVEHGDQDKVAEATSRAAVVLSEVSVGGALSAAMIELLAREPLAGAQVCVSVWDNHRRVESTDAAIGVLRFAEGSVLTVPSWRLDGSCYVTYMPATAVAWEKAIAEYVGRYQLRAKIA